MTTAAPLPVAVVLTFYRADATFPAALASVLAQSVPAAEIMVVDDCSPPGTARSLERLPPGVGIVRLPTNVGVNGARRSGTAATTAPLIAYLDADDSWPVDYLATMVAALEAAVTAPAAFAATARVWPDGRREVFTRKPAQLTIHEAIVHSHVLPSAMVARRAAVERAGGWHDNRRVVDDWHLIIRLIDTHGPMPFVPSVVVDYAVGNTASVNSRDVRVLCQWWHTLRELGPVVERHYGPGAPRRRFAKALVDRSHRMGGLRGGLLRLVARLLGPPLRTDQARQR